MQILASNFQPLETEHECFNAKFLELATKAERLNIAVGYISEKSINELIEIISKQGQPYCNLMIGMHHSEKFTRPQFAAVKDIERFFVANDLGTVKLTQNFPFHGKLYFFTDRHGNSNTIIGSSNLHNILQHKPTIQYEVDLLVDDEKLNGEFKNLIDRLFEISTPFDSANITEFKESENILDGLDGVEKISGDRLNKIKAGSDSSNISFEIPIKPFEHASKSNINAYFGKGRKDGKEPRPWYEVEIIVSNKITSHKDYPSTGIINVVTDDGYKFNCKMSGEDNKNFRSDDGLEILGKWLKGRLEVEGLLEIGTPVTKKILESYGRNFMTLTFIKEFNMWLLDFSPKRKLKHETF